MSLKQNEKDTEVEDSGFVNTATVGKPMTSTETDASRNCVLSSKHSEIHIMPNHAINKEGELEGFSFLCSPADSAAILPVSKTLFHTTCIYECILLSTSPYIQLMQDLNASEKKFREFIDIIANDTKNPLKLDCMQEDSLNSFKIKDEREWNEELPAKIGIYHCFMRTNVQNMREHKVFIIISGACRHASEEIYNLWLDARNTITAKQFFECAELNWLRKTTSRHHNRLAARLAMFFNFNVHYMQDFEAVGTPPKILLPTLSNVTHDINICSNRIVLSNNAAILNVCKSGIIFDCWANEGFWIFSGPRDTSEYKIFGSELSGKTNHFAFPTRTVRYHSQFLCKKSEDVIFVKKNVCGNSKFKSFKDNAVMAPRIIYSSKDTNYDAFLFPNTQFIEELNKLGFNTNDGINNLMPILVYCDDE